VATIPLLLTELSWAIETDKHPVMNRMKSVK